MTSIPRVIGRFEVVGQIDRGGRGALYRAWDPQLERPIAIRILVEDDEERRERFRRATRSAASLRHPHIATIVDVGEDQKRSFPAMEYIQGRRRADLIRRHEPISTLRKLQLMQELCEGLAPEQVAGESVDARSDIFAVGGVFYE